MGFHLVTRSLLGPRTRTMRRRMGNRHCHRRRRSRRNRRDRRRIIIITSSSSNSKRHRRSKPLKRLLMRTQ